MTVKELIEHLSKLPQDAFVYAWKGDRYEVVDVDDGLADQGIIDLNTGH
jgi:hypothetical protein